MSLAYALTRERPLAAVLNFSGFLADGVPVPQGADAPPLFWGHGLHDPAIPHALAVKGRAALAAAGVDVAISDHPIGHGIVPEEVAAALRVAGAA